MSLNIFGCTRKNSVFWLFFSFIILLRKSQAIHFCEEMWAMKTKQKTCYIMEIINNWLAFRQWKPSKRARNERAKFLFPAAEGFRRHHHWAPCMGIGETHKSLQMKQKFQWWRITAAFSHVGTRVSRTSGRGSAAEGNRETPIVLLSRIKNSAHNKDYSFHLSNGWKNSLLCADFELASVTNHQRNFSVVSVLLVFIINNCEQSLWVKSFHSASLARRGGEKTNGALKSFEHRKHSSSRQSWALSVLCRLVRAFSISIVSRARKKGKHKSRNLIYGAVKVLEGLRGNCITGELLSLFNPGGAARSNLNSSQASRERALHRKHNKRCSRLSCR